MYQRRSYSYLLLIVCMGMICVYLSYTECIGRSISKLDHINLNNNSTTIVTAFFQFSKSKHTIDEYKQWIENLLRYTENPMVIYTSKQMLSFIENIRNSSYLPTVIITDFETPWEIPTIQPIKNKLYSQIDIDPEKNIHSPDLYAIWNAKAWMVENVAVTNPFKTSYFFWIDIGAYRTANYRFRLWPDEKKISEIFDRKNSKQFLLGLINPISFKLCEGLVNSSKRYRIEDGPVGEDVFQGGFFGGSLESIHYWSQLYYSTMNLYIQKNLFIGKEQSIMNALAFAFPERIKVILTYNVSCGDSWFAFGPLLAKFYNVSHSFGIACQSTNLSSVIVPLINLCIR